MDVDWYTLTRVTSRTYKEHCERNNLPVGDCDTCEFEVVVLSAFRKHSAFREGLHELAMRGMEAGCTVVAEVKDIAHGDHGEMRFKAIGYKPKLYVPGTVRELW